MLEVTYQVNPVASAKLAVAGTPVLEAERFIESKQVVMRNNRNAIGNLSFSDPLDIRLHQSRTHLLSLVLGQHRQRVNGNGTTIFIVTNDLAILLLKTLGLPGLGELHGSIGHSDGGGSSRNNMPNKSSSRLGLVFL